MSDITEKCGVCGHTPAEFNALIAMIQLARPCVRNELNRCEQRILSIEKSKPTPSHLNPQKYLGALNYEANRLRETLDAIDKYLGIEPASGG
jgi:hypothetical protein